MNRFPVFAMALMLAGANLASAAPEVPDTFMKRLVAGINARDLGALKSLIRPETRRCVTSDTRDYYEWWLWKDGDKRYTIAEGYQLRLEEAAHVDRSMHWPVAPDYGLRISYPTARLSVMQRLFEIRLRDGEASLVMDCPAASDLKSFRVMRKAALAQKKKLERILSSMDPHDRLALEIMARQGMKLDGMKAAEQKYQLDATESLALMDMIEYADTP